MDWGLKNRFSKIIRPEDGRCVMLAVDHGYFLGPTEKLENPKETIKPLLSHADSIMLTRGILRTSVSPESNVPIVLRVSWGSSIIGEDLSNETIVTSIDEAIKLNASCLALSVFVGSKYESQTLTNLAKLVDEGQRFDIPVLAVTAVGKEMARDARYLALACRIAAELGAHIVKTYYCKDFTKVVESCPIPIIIAGGKKISEKDALQLTFDAINDGASGVDMGRNIWQSDHPIAMIKAVKSIVHENYNFQDAYDLFVTESKGKGKIQIEK
jgi:3-hydroxy-5-phosphonooxypentane-2,4-dione thiolase